MRPLVLLRPKLLFAGCTLTAILLLLSPRSSRAEDSVAYKFQSWQEEAGRIRVDAHYALAEKDFGLNTKLRLTGVIDTIVGATPTGEPPPDDSEQVPLALLEDRREAWQAELSHQWPRLNLTGSFATSRESDYESDSCGLNALVDFNQKATTLLVGFNRADDDVTARFLTAPRRKRTDDFIVGLTQLLNPLTAATLNVTWGQADGYLSDPYKIVRRTTEIVPGLSLPLTFPENRPGEKERWIVYGSINRRLTGLDAALDLSWRWLDDTFGVTSQTLTLEWYQTLRPNLILRPSVRWYQQSAADFYYPDLDATAITPSPQPTGEAPYYSSDHRLAALRTTTLGLKLIWEWRPGWSFDASYERYLMRGRDERTPASAFADANVFTVGLRFSR